MRRLYVPIRSQWHYVSTSCVSLLGVITTQHRTPSRNNNDKWFMYLLLNYLRSIERFSLTSILHSALAKSTMHLDRYIKDIIHLIFWSIFQANSLLVLVLFSLLSGHVVCYITSNALSTSNESSFFYYSLLHTVLVCIILL